MIISRRFLLSAVLLAGLSGCVEAIGDSVDTGDYKVTRVSVDLSEFQGVEGGREIDVPREKVERDLSSALTSILAAETANNSRPVNVGVKIKEVYLVSPGQSLLLGGISRVIGVLTVIDAASGAVLIPPTDVVGTPDDRYAAGGLIGLATTKSPQKDYDATVNAFAVDVRNSLFPANN